ncbi:hypothetical protein [Alkaliphilus serpentinus]|uniref:hypothetical protein n=1 Tax=Alkaliphilus serpentinus TaxID=1482731 RepID=UPI0018658897|nr:hypothetical protein [Alkaliphilus serpentinus]
MRNLKFKIGSYNFNIKINTATSYDEAALVKERLLHEVEESRQKALDSYTSFNLSRVM